MKLRMNRSPNELSVAVLIVIHNDAADLPACLAALDQSVPSPRELWIADCDSRDDGITVAKEHWPKGLSGGVLDLKENRGFAGGMNAAFAASTADWVLTLNADALIDPDYLLRLIDRAESATNLRVGALTGRLRRYPSPGEANRLDACGMYLTPTWRHLDRESGVRDRGQLQTAERVFGATGAASLFRREALLDAAFEDDQIFDESFHTYREDAELCFRLQARGWEVLYEPLATAAHRRFNLPTRRSEIPARFNYHSLKNRYLIRSYHQTLFNFLWTLPTTLIRDLGALLWVLARERTSIAAYRWLWHRRKEIAQRRHWVQSRKTRPGRELDRWFLRRSLPLDSSKSVSLPPTADRERSTDD